MILLAGHDVGVRQLQDVMGLSDPLGMCFTGRYRGPWHMDIVLTRLAS